MFQTFGDIPLCMNQRDDIILRGKDKEEHYRIVEKILQGVKEYRVKFNREKSEFGKTEITWLNKKVRTWVPYLKNIIVWGG